MKTISITPKLHDWIMSHKSGTNKSAEKVIWGMIEKIDLQEERINGLISMLPK